VKAEVAIVGNGVGGYACAAKLARHGIRPLLVGRGLPVDRPPLTKSALTKGAPVLLADETRLAERGIDRIDALVVEADLAAGTLRVDSDDAVVETDTIVLATGLRYGRPPIPGIEVAHVNAVPAELEAISAVLAAGPRRVVVVGAGLIGTETAATLAKSGHEVTVLDVLDRPLDRLHDPLPALGADALAATGARFHGGVSIGELRQEGEVLTVVCDLGALTADLVLAATGGAPVTPPGLGPDVALPIEVDAALRVPGHERVLAVGDLIVVPHARFGPMRFPHWDMAIGTGEHAADVVAGVAGELDRLPYWWTDIGPHTFAEVGWAEAVAEWTDEAGMHVGRDPGGEPVAALVVDEPRRLREARAIVAG
jgi:NADPH-dependent 2,4-dienoyl-CoA reductase/sulfur reductase-like enzyme